MIYVTQEHLKRILEAKLEGRSQASLCREIGVRPQHLSLMVNGAPINGKVLAYLGYEKAEGLYRRVRRKGAA